MGETDNILTVDKLTKHFKDFSLQNVSFQLPRGYVMGFIGPNGSGKSTTIKLTSLNFNGRFGSPFFEVLYQKGILELNSHAPLGAK